MFQNRQTFRSYCCNKLQLALITVNHKISNTSRTISYPQSDLVTYGERMVWYFGVFSSWTRSKARPFQCKMSISRVSHTLLIKYLLLSTNASLFPKWKFDKFNQFLLWGSQVDKGLNTNRYSLRTRSRTRGQSKFHLRLPWRKAVHVSESLNSHPRG